MIKEHPLVKDLNWRDPDYLPFFHVRMRTLEAIRRDKSGRLLAAHMSHYRNDGAQGIYDFMCDWLLTFDPRNPQKAIMPFIPFTRQCDYIEWLEDVFARKTGGLVEKTRDIGISYMSLAWSVHRWLFHQDQQIAFGSYKQDLVDNIGAPNSLLEKVRMMLRGLPPEFLPQRVVDGNLQTYNENRDAKFMVIQNRENGSTIIGEVGDNIGRGGRSSIYFVDESAHLVRPLKADAALSANTDCPIHMSSVNGPPPNAFAQKRFSGDWEVLTLRWESDPRKDKAWYDAICAKYRQTPWIIASEYGIDYTASQEGILIPFKWVRAAVNAHLDPELGWEATGAKSTALDVADEGGDSNALANIHGNVAVAILEWFDGTTTETARKAYGYASEFGSELFRYDSIGVGAGVKGEVTEITRTRAMAERIPCKGINVGSSGLAGLYKSGKRNKDMFKNLKAQLWWLLRDRFENTYNRITLEQKHIDPMSCISIPDDNDLCLELSSPLRVTDEAGRIQVEPKRQMLKRGIRSTNKADALVMGMAPHKIGKQVGVY